MSRRKCAYCKTPFTKQRLSQRVCSATCGIAIHQQDKAKAQDKAYRARKKALKTISQHLSETQVVFNRFIRLRDRDQPCISCQRHHDGQYHAGHYRPRGQNSALRFSELNTHKQCAPCNNHKSGNITEYRENLIQKIGLEMVEWLDNNNEIKKWEIEEAQDLKKYYRDQIKRLESDYQIMDSV